MTDSNLQERAINTIRFLSADAIQKANSGHPGMPMGAAAMAYTLWSRHLRFDPKQPEWWDRDRFVLSGGHGSMLLYSLLHLTGYDLSIEDIKSFRQLGSKTPGHPESTVTPGVEVTTGPLGQGLANAVGMAIAEAHMAAEFNKSGKNIIDHYVYAIVTDGDLMEGISSEAGSLAGHLGLGKLVLLYDDNRISIDGTTELTFSEDRCARFEAFGWHVQIVENGNDVDAIDKAISRAKNDPRPSIIACRTHIGYGMPNKQDTAKAHGEPPGEEELRKAKEKLGWPVEPMFLVPEDVRSHFLEIGESAAKAHNKWNTLFEEYSREHQELAAELTRRMRNELPEGWDSSLPVFTPADGDMATRNVSGKAINALAEKLPEMMGGSADLTPSNKTWINGSPSFQRDSRGARNIHFGIREHAMGAIINGMAAHGGIIPFCGTFLMFSDYMRAAIRLSALSEHRSIWVFTHDSIGVGEDGPTHQPVEHLASLRAIPGLVVIRPGDANESVEAWRVAISRTHGPTLIAFTRQKIPILDRDKFSPSSGLMRGAYVLSDLGDDPEIVLMASGSEVHLIVEAGEQLAGEGIGVRIVSFPSWELFEMQDQEYRDSVIPPSVHARLAVEAGVSQGWHKWVGDHGDVISVERFGTSAPNRVIFREYGFTVENVVEHAKKILGR
ncbi:MAG: transketolase [Candidatus Thorarchaeota archaeon]|nr:MAG: transketolase [Candidatus Thorarchaeota archaeon]RLI58842.1 MAG: transketolase [Candidatus Thorarchaeota archaeon]